MQNRRFFVLGAAAALFFAGGNAFAAEGGKPGGEERTFRKLDGELRMNVSTILPPVGIYNCLDNIEVRFRPSLDGKYLTSGKLAYSTFGDDGERSNGVIELTGEEVVVPAKLLKPGFVRIRTALLDDDGAALYTQTVRGKPRITLFNSCVGADEKRVPQVREPADFDAFWMRTKKLLHSVPAKAELREIPGRDPANFKTYEASVACPGPMPVTGYLFIPRKAKERSLPAEIVFDGYGAKIPAPDAAASGRIVFQVNPHGTPFGKDKAFYETFFKSLQGYGKTGNADPQKCYFHGMALRALRALEFVRALPEWDGENLMVSGSSQGGMQALWAAALDEKVTFCRVAAPWNCNLGSEQFGLMPRLGGVPYVPGVRYYDGVHHAKRIACPVEISRAGLGDFVCPPSGVARLYGNLNGPKRIVWYINNGHEKPTGETAQFVLESPGFQKPAAFAE